MQSFKFLKNFIYRSPLGALGTDIEHNIFMESIYLSTPVLHEEILKHQLTPLTDTKELKKLNISLYKYKVRASNRCTPFGLFAGLGVGEWKDQNLITLDSDKNKSLNRKTRLDMNVLCSLTYELIKKPFIKPYLKFYPNTSLYLNGDNYRYVEYYYEKNNRFHKINKIDFNTYLQHILTESKVGLNLKELEALISNDEFSADEISAYITDLVDSQILVNQFEPTISGIDYFSNILNNLFSISESNKNEELDVLINLLTEVDRLLKVNDANIFNVVESYKVIYDKLKVLLPGLTEINLFQTDLYKSSNNAKLDSGLQEQLKNALQFLSKINPAGNDKNFNEFKNRFYERYEDYEVPLLIALDTESGIGYPARDADGLNELVDDVYPHRSNQDRSFKWNQLQTHILKLINDSLKHNKKVVEISEHDFKDVDFSKETMSRSFSVMFKLLNSSSNKIALTNVGGPSAINLLGRFAGGNNELRTIIDTITEFEQEQMPDSILAEIVHLPEARTGNILARPAFRKYEIPYLAKSSVDNEFQIKMEDLVLKMVNNRLILFDKRLNKEIIPRLGNAHNFLSNSLPVYHFLCDLQFQDSSKNYLGFSWGVLANQYSFLPRVEYCNTVLSAAKWQLQKSDLEFFHDKKKSDEEKYNYFIDLKIRLELPDLFLIIEDDNELLIDCKDRLAIDVFIDTVKKRNKITLEEYLFDNENVLIKDSLGNAFTNECIAIVLNEHERLERQTLKKVKTYNSKQIFSPGSEWLYYKIYCGVKTADTILTEKLKNITELLLKNGAIDKWFFIRYSDPDVHLRVRFHISDQNKYSEVMQLMNSELEPLIQQNMVSKIMIDTYKRELDRYGDNSIELVEQLFFYDSVFVTDMLALLDAQNGGAIRWQMALRSVDEFLNDFGLSLEEKYKLIDSLSQSFFKEHGEKKELRLILDNKYRSLRGQIDKVMNSSDDEQMEYMPIIELLNERSRCNKPLVNEILSLKNNNTLELTLDSMLASLLHMNLDRLFMGRNRTNELVVYDILSRVYKSSLARLKHKQHHNSKKEYL